MGTTKVRNYSGKTWAEAFSDIAFYGFALAALLTVSQCFQASNRERLRAKSAQEHHRGAEQQTGDSGKGNQAK